MFELPLVYLSVFLSASEGTGLLCIEIFLAVALSCYDFYTSNL